MKTAIDYDNKNGIYHFNRGLIKMNMNKVDEAIEALKKSAQYIEPNNNDQLYQARFNLGVCYRRKSNLDESIEQFRKALILNPEKASCLNNLGLSFFEKGDFEEAIPNFNKAIRLERSPLYYNNRALVHARDGNKATAKQDFD